MVLGVSGMGLKTVIKRVTPPTVWAKLFKIRHEVIGGFLKRGEVRALMEKIGSPTHPLAGPFSDMQCLDEATGSAFFPKMVGTYELEIRDAIEWMVNYKPDLVVNVGCAEGYYAVGMARRLPKAKVVAFDIESRARRLTHKLASINNVETRVGIGRKCTVSNLEPLCAAAQKPAIIVDCEGFEDHLLVPQHVPSLAKTVILVEVHDCFAPGVSQRLRERFADTHSIQQYDVRPRIKSDLPSRVSLDETTGLKLMDEQRNDGENGWMLMVPR
jgi:hypothetical protein